MLLYLTWMPDCGASVRIVTYYAVELHYMYTVELYYFTSKICFFISDTDCLNRHNEWHNNFARVNHSV
jgi:hypothetical protein